SSCQTELTATKEEALTLSNRLEIFQTTSLTLSNHLMEAQSALAESKQDLTRQVTGLNQQLEKLTMQHEGEKQVATHRISELAQQVAELTNQLASARANLHQANKDYALLEDRFRRDVAERLIVERKFHNRAELKAQLEALLWNPNNEISEDRIREGLNVVVGQSNRWYVIAPE
ncbi:MAG TPA: hypothetical protein VHI52_02880, partial [Verrucomicrobiae bacterium]|nr:hypothetical protein [Verrucomicrobiae bacterium]